MSKSIGRFIRKGTTLLMYIGGALIFAETLVVLVSVLRGVVVGKPLSWDFEVIKLLNALIIFCFLPYTQLFGAHVSADLFMTRAPEWFVKWIDALSHAIFGLFALLLLWRMSLGAIAYYDPVFPEMTTSLEIPLWWMFPPILGTLVFWATVSFHAALFEAKIALHLRAHHDL